MSQIYFIGVIIYMCRTVFPSIIRSSRLYSNRHTSNRYCRLLASGKETFHPVPASKQSELSDICLLLYVQSLTPDD